MPVGTGICSPGPDEWRCTAGPVWNRNIEVTEARDTSRQAGKMVGREEEGEIK